MAEHVRYPKEGFEPLGSSEPPLRQPGESVAGTTEEARARVEHKARQWKEQAQEKVKSTASEQTAKAAHGLEATAEALRQTSQTLRERDRASLAKYAEKAADQTEHFSNYLLNKDIDQLIGDAENLVRRSPWIALGGALFAGALLARFLKASGEKID